MLKSKKASSPNFQRLNAHQGPYLHTYLRSLLSAWSFAAESQRAVPCLPPELTVTPTCNCQLGSLGRAKQAIVGYLIPVWNAPRLGLHLSSFDKLSRTSYQTLIIGVCLLVREPPLTSCPTSVPPPSNTSNHPHAFPLPYHFQHRPRTDLFLFPSGLFGRSGSLLFLLRKPTFPHLHLVDDYHNPASLSPGFSTQGCHTGPSSSAI